MAKPELGKKHTCPSCNTKFYDMRRSPIVCPQCGTKVEPALAGGRKGRGGRTAASPAPAAAPEVESEETTPEVEEVPAEEDGLGNGESGGENEESYSDVIEDTSELGEESAFASVGDEDEEST